MYYYGYFRDTDIKTDNRGNLYKVIIITNFKSKEYEVGGELLLSSSPFTVSWNGEDDNLYKGYKCSTATVGFYQENYNFDFNNTSGNNVFVALGKLKKDKKVEDDLGITTDGDVYDILWTGYATPNAYSQDYNSHLDYFELECQDALSTLKYIEYTGDDITGHSYTRFSDLLIKYIGGLGNYKHIYTTSSLVVPSEDLGGICEFLYIDEANFYDEDTKGMEVLEILREMCVYLGITMIPWGDSIFLIDYYSLESGDYREIYSTSNGDYSFLSGSNWAIGEASSFFHHRELQKDDFLGSDTSLTLGNTYNKVEVTSDLYGLETIIYDKDDDDIYDYSTLFDTVGDYGSSKVLSSDESGTEIYTTYKINGDDSEETHHNKTLYCFKNINNSIAGVGNFLRTFTTRWYNLDTGEQQDGTLRGMYGTTNQYNATYADLRNYVGATFVEYASNEVGSETEELTGDVKTAIIMSLHNNKVFSSSDIQGLEYSNGWRNLWNSAGDTIIKTESSIKQIMFTVNTEKILLGKEDYIFIKGNFTFFNNNGFYVPLENKGDSYSDLHPTNLFVWCSLSDGKGNYWDGNKWKTRAEFTIPSFVDGEDTVLGEPIFKMPLKFIKDSKAYGVSLPITSYTDLSVAIEEDGCVIPSPVTKDDTVIPIELNFSMYRPWGTRYNSHIAELALLEDFDITVTRKKEGSKKLDPTDNTNTSYTNILSDTVLEEYGDIDLKITSYSGKQINRSNVYWFNKSPKNLTGNPITAGWDFHRLTHLANKSTGQIGKPEELIIHNITKQYSSPTVCLETTLFNSLGLTPYSTVSYHFLGDRIFAVDGMTIDYEYDTIKVKLIERKGYGLE